MLDNFKRGDNNTGMKRLVCSLGLALVLAGCSSDDATLNLDKTVTKGYCERGNVVFITLGSNPTTGYAWVIAKDGSPVLKLVSQKYTAPDTGLVGAGGTEEIAFIAENPGSAKVSLEYRRPWETDKPAAETVEFEVGVR